MAEGLGSLNDFMEQKFLIFQSSRVGLLGGGRAQSSVSGGCCLLRKQAVWWPPELAEVDASAWLCPLLEAVNSFGQLMIFITVPSFYK
ncbi:Centromere protein V-like protein 1 [Manis javanica]|nr:Centromere protein V-like protein 1 [Manis javanica]